MTDLSKLLNPNSLIQNNCLNLANVKFNDISLNIFVENMLQYAKFNTHIEMVFVSNFLSKHQLQLLNKAFPNMHIEHKI